MARHPLTFWRLVISFFPSAGVITLSLCHQCILPCIVQLLPRDSPLVHCIRAYSRYRTMVGMHCMSESRIQKLETYITDYKRWCTVSCSCQQLIFINCFLFRKSLKYMARISTFSSSMQQITSWMISCNEALQIISRHDLVKVFTKNLRKRTNKPTVSTQSIRYKYSVFKYATSKSDILSLILTDGTSWSDSRSNCCHTDGN